MHLFLRFSGGALWDSSPFWSSSPDYRSPASSQRSMLSRRSRKGMMAQAARCLLWVNKRRSIRMPTEIKESPTKGPAFLLRFSVHHMAPYLVRSRPSELRPRRISSPLRRSFLFSPEAWLRPGLRLLHHSLRLADQAPSAADRGANMPLDRIVDNPPGRDSKSTVESVQVFR